MTLIAVGLLLAACEGDDPSADGPTGPSADGAGDSEVGAVLDGVEPTVSSGVAPAILRDCVDESSGEAQELRGSIVSAWYEVLAEIETIDEVESLAEEFSDCLRNAGVPPEAASDEFTFLQYVDQLQFEAGGDQDEIDRVAEEYGKLYVECGRELFEARERLRGGERRTAFLAEHADAIRELSDLLYGGQ